MLSHPGLQWLFAAALMSQYSMREPGSNSLTQTYKVKGRLGKECVPVGPNSALHLCLN